MTITPGRWVAGVALAATMAASMAAVMQAKGEPVFLGGDCPVVIHPNNGAAGLLMSFDMIEPGSIDVGVVDVTPVEDAVLYPVVPPGNDPKDDFMKLVAKTRYEIRMEGYEPGGKPRTVIYPKGLPEKAREIVLDGEPRKHWPMSVSASLRDIKTAKDPVLEAWVTYDAWAQRFWIRKQ